MSGSKFRAVPTEDLLHIWRVLENLTVSLNRLGHYERERGEAAAATELGRHLSPELARDIVSARRMVIQALTENDSAMYCRLEALAEDEAAIGYWPGGPRR